MKKLLSFLIIAIVGCTFISESKAQVYTSYSYYSPYDYDFPYHVSKVINNYYYGYQVVDVVSFYNGPHLSYGLTLFNSGTYFDVVIDPYGHVVNRVVYHRYPQRHVWVNYVHHPRHVTHYYPRGHKHYRVYANHYRHEHHGHHGHAKYHSNHHDKKHYSKPRDNHQRDRIDLREPERKRNYQRETNSNDRRSRVAATNQKSPSYDSGSIVKNSNSRTSYARRANNRNSDSGSSDGRNVHVRNRGGR